MVRQVLTAEYLEELDPEMALDGEDSTADDDTISDAGDDHLLSSLIVPGGYDAEEVARQTVAAGMRRSLRRFEVLDHPRPVRTRDRILPN